MASTHHPYACSSKHHLTFTTLIPPNLKCEFLAGCWVALFSQFLLSSWQMITAPCDTEEDEMELFSVMIIVIPFHDDTFPASVHCEMVSLRLMRLMCVQMELELRKLNCSSLVTFVWPVPVGGEGIISVCGQSALFLFPLINVYVYNNESVLFGMWYRSDGSWILLWDDVEADRQAEREKQN